MLKRASRMALADLTGRAAPASPTDLSDLISLLIKRASEGGAGAGGGGSEDPAGDGYGFSAANVDVSASSLLLSPALGFPFGGRGAGGGAMGASSVFIINAQGEYILFVLVVPFADERIEERLVTLFFTYYFFLQEIFF